MSSEQLSRDITKILVPYMSEAGRATVVAQILAAIEEAGYISAGEKVNEKSEQPHTFCRVVAGRRSILSRDQR